MKFALVAHFGVDVKIKIGVMGSATGNFSKKIKEISYEVGCAIAKNDCITITGA